MSASRKLLKLQQLEGNIFIEPLSDRVPTYLNDEILLERNILKLHDVVSFNQKMYEFQLESVQPLNKTKTPKKKLISASSKMVDKENLEFSNSKTPISKEKKFDSVKTPKSCLKTGLSQRRKSVSFTSNSVVEFNGLLSESPMKEEEEIQPMENFVQTPSKKKEIQREQEEKKLSFFEIFSMIVSFFLFFWMVVYLLDL
jgi:hypothetical protein